MPITTVNQFLLGQSLDKLPQRLSAVNRNTLAHARQTRLQSTLDPAKLTKAKAIASATVNKLKAKAAARRSPSLEKMVDLHETAMSNAHKRIKQILQGASPRPPATVIRSFLDRPQSPQRTLVRTEMASLLIRSSHKDLPAFMAELAQVMGLQTANEFSARNIDIRQLLPDSDGSGATYTIRLPVKRSGVATEIHNLAWALRKSKKFASVRPDGLRKLIFGVKLTHAKRAERVFAWPLILTRTLEAHDLPPQPNGHSLGEGIVIAHPDTGWAPHPQYNQQQIDQARSFNVSSGNRGGNAARHSIRIADAGIPNLAHGTATGSVILGGNGSGNRSADIEESELIYAVNGDNSRNYMSDRRVVDTHAALTGVAPRATVRPIKFIDDVLVDIDRTGLNGAGVVRIADEDLVTALNYARTSGAHVISLSVGGLMHDAVREAIDRAVEENLIVVAAAGQTYTMAGLNNISQAASGLGLQIGDTVILPAAYANVIAVAGCSPDGRPWDESFRGPNVDITAPADGLWVADFDKKKVDANGNCLPLVESASGTSFAAAFMAGVAALWLAHWGRDQLLARYPGIPLAWVLRHQLQRTANAAHATDWDHTNYGPGVVDVRALLMEPLPPPRLVQAPPATTPNVFTALSGALGTQGADLAGDVFGMIYDIGASFAEVMKQFGEAAWAAVRAMAEGMMSMGQKALEDLHALIEAAGGVIDRATSDAIAAVTSFIEAAAEVAEDAAEAAAQAGESAVDAVVDFVENTADAVGEAGEAVAEFLFGWLPD